MIRLIRLLHNYLGLILGLPLLISALSAAVYVWQPELTTWLYPELYCVPDNKANVLSLDSLLHVVEHTENQSINRMYFPERERQSFVFTFKQTEGFHFYSPIDGSKLGELKQRRGLLDVVLKLHTFSYFPNGKYFIAWVSILCVFIIFSSGYYLWWPKNRKFKAFDFKLSRRSLSNRIWPFLLHRVLGMYLSLFILIVGLSGVYFVYKKPFKQMLQTMGSDVQISQKNSKVDLPDDYDFSEALQPLENYFVDYHPRSIILNYKNSGHTYISWMKFKEMHNGKKKRAYALFDPNTNFSIVVSDPLLASRMDVILDAWLPPFHFGEWGAWFSRILYFLGSLGFSALIVFGYWSFFKRRKRR